MVDELAEIGEAGRNVRIVLLSNVCGHCVGERQPHGLIRSLSPWTHARKAKLADLGFRGRPLANRAMQSVEGQDTFTDDKIIVTEMTLHY
jgi:hypothetical protein